jgi:large subunit ribosomal protein L1
MAPLLSSFHQQVRGAKSNPQAKGKKDKGKTTKKEKKGPRDFKQKDLKDVEQFALCDAVR